MFERFTDDGRRLLDAAAVIARGFSEVRTEHLLLAIIDDEHETFAQTALISNGISHDNVVEHAYFGGSGVPKPHDVPLSDDYKKLLELSLREALQLGSSYIEPLHLLLAMIRQGDSTALSIIRSLGGELNKIRRDVIELKTKEYFVPREPVETSAKPKRSPAVILQEINNHSVAIRHLTAELELVMSEDSSCLRP